MHAVRYQRSATPNGIDRSPLSILLLADSFLPHAGGSREYYHNLYRSLVLHGSDRVTVLTKKVPGWKEFDARVSTDRYQIIRRFRPLPNWKYHQLPKMVLPLLDAVRCAESKQLIHAGDLFPQGLIALFLKQMFHVPYMVYCHGEEITQIDHRRLQPKLRDLIYKNADGVIAANEFARENLRRVGVDTSRIFKVLPGVDTNRFRPGPRDKELVAKLALQDKTVILSVGRLVKRKGHAIVLHALAKAKNDCRAFHYLIAGEGPEKESLQALVTTLGLSDQVTLMGKIREESLPVLYNTCDLFVLANCDVKGDVEGFGMVFLEANAAGKAVLGGRTGGTAEAVIDNCTGLLVDPENVTELASALKLLLCNPDLRSRLGCAGMQRAIAEFSWLNRAQDLRTACATVYQRAATSIAAKRSS